MELASSGASLVEPRSDPHSAAPWRRAYFYCVTCLCGSWSGSRKYVLNFLALFHHPTTISGRLPSLSVLLRLCFNAKQTAVVTC